MLILFFKKKFYPVFIRKEKKSPKWRKIWKLISSYKEGEGFDQFHREKVQISLIWYYLLRLRANLVKEYKRKKRHLRFPNQMNGNALLANTLNNKKNAPVKKWIDISVVLLDVGFFVTPSFDFFPGFYDVHTSLTSTWRTCTTLAGKRQNKHVYLK